MVFCDDEGDDSATPETKSTFYIRAHKYFVGVHTNGFLCIKNILKSTHKVRAAGDTKTVTQVMILIAKVSALKMFAQMKQANWGVWALLVK